MANNRLILVYRPTGRAVVIAKRMGAGWYSHESLTSRLNGMFDESEFEGFAEMKHDDFELVIEDAVQAPVLSSDWTYAEKGLLHIKHDAPQSATERKDDD